MGDAEQQKELESIRMHRHANPKELFSQITAIEIKYRGRASELSEKSKLTNVILRSPDEYAQTIQTTRQLTKAESPPREPTIKELQTAMYDYYCTRRPRRDHGGGRNRHHHEMSLYTGDDSDGSTGSRKRWSSKKKSVRNNPRDSRECYGCGKKGHIKRDCRSTGNGGRRSGKCSHCGKTGHQEAECWKKHPEKTPDWLKKKTREMAGIALDGETAFISISDSIPVETVQEEEIKSVNKNESDSDSDSEDGDSMPGLKARNDDESSIDSNEDPEDPEDDIDWNPEEPIPEFRETYQDEEGRQARQIQETWIIDQLNKEEVSLVTFHLMFPIREKYSYWHLDGKTDEDVIQEEEDGKTNEDAIREEDIQIIRDWRSLDNGGPREVQRTNYGFGLEDIEGLKNLKGFPWWKFKQSSRLRILGQWDKFLAPTANQRAILSWIMEQNWTEVQVAEANRIVQKLQEETEARKEHARHMQRQAPKRKKKPKKPVVIGGKQKNKDRKLPPE